MPGVNETEKDKDILVRGVIKRPLSSRSNSLKSSPLSSLKKPATTKSNNNTNTSVSKRIIESVKKINLSNTELTSFDFNELFTYEFIYARNGELNAFNIAVFFPALKVLDLSSNEIEDLSFLSLMPNLKHLFLTCNKVKSFESMPFMEQLESLVVGNNEISSWKGLRNLPRLRALSLPFNTIQNFYGIPYFPELEALDLSENPISNSPLFKEISIALFRQLRVLNKELLTQEMLEAGNEYVDLIAEAVRYGLIISDETYSDINTLKNLAKEWILSAHRDISKLTPLHLLDYFFITDNPIQGYPITFYSVFQVVQDIDPCIINAVGMGYLEVVCPSDFELYDRFILNEALCVDVSQIKEPKYTLLVPSGSYNYYFTNETGLKTEVITRDVSEKIIEDKEEGITEFSVEYLWETGENTPTIIPSYENISQVLTVNVYLKKNDEEVLKINGQTSKTLPGLPKCINIGISGDLREGEVVTAVSEYEGGDEAEDPEYEWRRIPEGNDNVTDFEVVHRGLEYRLTHLDYGKLLAVTYTPKRVDGTIGSPATFTTSETVDSSTPKASNLRITYSVAEQDIPMTVEYDFTGGIEGDSQFQWAVETEQKNVFQKIKGAISKSFTPKSKHVGKVLKCLITPVNTDGKIGTVEEIVLAEVVKPSNPRFVNVTIEAEKFMENDVIKINTKYYGGLEGNSYFEYFRVNDNGEEEKIEVSTESYTLSLRDVGKTLKIVCTPVRNDGIVGESVVAQTPKIVPGIPKITKLEIIGNVSIDSIIHVHSIYEGGVEGESHIEWLRSEPVELTGTSSLDNLIYSKVAEDIREYKITKDDLLCFIKVIYVPVRNDNAKGSEVNAITSTFVASNIPVLSNARIMNTNESESDSIIEGDTLKGFADFEGCKELERHHKWFKLNEVTEEESEIEGADSEQLIINSSLLGYKIKYSCRPVDFMHKIGEWCSSEPTKMIAPKKPTITSMKIIGVCEEGGVLSVVVEGENVDANNSKKEWTRVKGESDKGTFLCEGSQYVIKHSDIGHAFKCRVYPQRPSPFEHIMGESKEVMSTFVEASQPEGTCRLEGALMEGEKVTTVFGYNGGKQGDSSYKLYRLDEATSSKTLLMEGNITSSTNKVTYTCTLEDVEKYLLLQYIPIREDGVSGVIVSYKTQKVEPAFPVVKDLRFQINKYGSSLDQTKVSPLEDSILSVQATYYGGYEGNSLRRWRRIDGGNNDIIAIETGEYKIQQKDIGHVIQFEYTPIRRDGVKGKEQVVQTNPVQAHDPSISNVKISGNSFIGSKLSVSGLYHGGVEGNSIVEWFVSPSKSGPFQKIETLDPTIKSDIIEGQSSRVASIPLTTKLLLKFVKAQYTPIRSDNAKGTTQESNIVEILLDPAIKSKILESVTKGSALQFCGQRVIELSNKNVQVKEGKSTLLKEKWGNLSSISLVDANTILITGAKKTEIQLNSPEAPFIALLLSVFSCLSNETICDEVCGHAFYSSWKKGIKAGDWENIKPNLNVQTNSEEVKVLLSLFK
ncbi:hypothetical protein ABK040_005387 [Willaertia magna]